MDASKKIMDLLKKIFIVSLLIFYPLGEIARFTFSDAAITFNDIGVVLVVTIWILFRILKRKRVTGRFVKPISVFVGISILSLVVNLNNLTPEEGLISALYLIRWIFYALLIFVVKEFDEKFKKKIIHLMLVGGGLIILGGFLQYFLYPDLRNLYYAGWDGHLYRMFSSFLDPNFAGSFFTLYFILALGFYFPARGWSAFGGKTKQKIMIAVLALSVMAILLTFSRGAFVMFFAGSFTFLVLQKQKKLIAGLLLLFVLSFILVSKTGLQSEGTNLLRTASGEARADSLKNAITIFKDHPVFGVGFNSYRYAQRSYGFINEEKLPIHSGAGTDNSFLFVLATTGVVGFIAFLFLIYKILALSFVSVGKNPIALVLFVSLTSLLFNSLFINTLFYPPIMLWMWILIGLTENT